MGKLSQNFQNTGEYNPNYIEERDVQTMGKTKMGARNKPLAGKRFYNYSETQEHTQSMSGYFHNRQQRW